MIFYDEIESAYIITNHKNLRPIPLHCNSKKSPEHPITPPHRDPTVTLSRLVLNPHRDPIVTLSRLVLNPHRNPIVTSS